MNTNALIKIAHYSGTGVLAVWLTFTNLKLTNMEDKWLKCYEDQFIRKGQAESNQPVHNSFLAVLPKKIETVKE